MKRYAFKAENGMCPQCIAHGKKYYIQDRYYGGRYEYALMSLPVSKNRELKFNDIYGVVEWLVGEDIRDDNAIRFIMGQHVDYKLNFEDMCMLKRQGEKYVLDKRRLCIRPFTEPVQETGWFQSYYECLGTAKELLERIEKIKNGEQMELFR